MCLSTIKTEKEMKEWLKTQPDMITAYKFIERTPKLRTFLDMLFRRNKIRYSLSPIHYRVSCKKYRKKNRIKGDRPTIRSISYDNNISQTRKNYFGKSYKAYFHLWIDKPEQSIKESDDNFVIIECHVPKYLITALGTEEMVVKTIYVQTDVPKKMGTVRREYEHIPVIVSRGFNIVDY